MKKIIIIATAFNEESNVLELHKQLNEVTSKVKITFSNIFLLKMEAQTIHLKICLKSKKIIQNNNCKIIKKFWL